MLTACHIALRLLIWSLIGFGLLLVLVMVRLDAGPIELGWLKPRIERALSFEGGAIAATAEGAELRLSEDSRTLELVGIDVRYQVRGEEGMAPYPFLIFPEVEVKLSVEALLKRGMIAASAIEAKAPSLIITQHENGIFGLFSEADYEGQVDDIDFGGFLRDFAMGSAEHDRLAFLERLQIGGGLVAYHDRERATTLTAKNADLVMSRGEGGVEAWLRADIVQPSANPASVQLSGWIDPDARAISFEANVADFMPADLSTLWPRAELWPDHAPAILAELRGVRLPVHASIDGQVGLDAAFSPLNVELHAEAGDVDLPDVLAEPLEIAAAAFRGTVDPGRGAVDIERATIASRGARLEAAGDIVWPASARSVRLDLSASQVRAEDLTAFWPPRLGIDAREWVLDNIRAGLVSEAEARLDLRPEDWDAQSLREEAVDGGFSFEGLSVRYVDEMPALEQASGRATFNAERMDFDIAGGNNAGVNLKGGSVTITGIGKPGKLDTQLQVLADAEGSIEQVLAVLDHPPLEVASEIGIAPAETAGSVTAKIDVRVPLHEDVTDDDAVVLATAELTDLSIERLPKLGLEIRLDQGAFDLVIDEETVRLDGGGDINGVPLQIDVTEPLDEAETATRRIALSGSLDREQRERLGIVHEGLDGTVGFDAVVTETSNNFWVDFEADLTHLAIRPPVLVWEKPEGQAGLFRASVAMPVDGPVEVKTFELQTDDLQAAGSLSLAPSNDRLASLIFDSFRQGDTDATIRILPDGEDGIDVEINAARLDLDALFGVEQEIGDGFQNFEATVQADQLRLRGIDLVDVTADVVHDRTGLQTASMFGAFPKGGWLAIDLAPDGDDRRLDLSSNNAGVLIEAFDLGRQVEGGDLRLSARLVSQDPVIAEGRFEIDSFILQDAPLLARMLTLASLTGIVDILGGEGMRVDHLLLPFTLNDQTLAFKDGLLRGSEVGLTVKGDIGLEAKTFNLAGTIIPVYTLNRLIGRVPVIGRILTGVDGRGAFAATYSITGPHDNPAVYVNPLSILTPGLIRDFVGGLVNGTGEPADVRETDD